MTDPTRAQNTPNPTPAESLVTICYRCGGTYAAASDKAYDEHHAVCPGSPELRAALARM